MCVNRRTAKGPHNNFPSNTQAISPPTRDPYLLMWRRLPFLIGCLPGPSHSQMGLKAKQDAGKLDIVTLLDKAVPELYNAQDKVRPPPHSHRLS